MRWAITVVLVLAMAGAGAAAGPDVFWPDEVDKDGKFIKAGERATPADVIERYKALRKEDIQPRKAWVASEGYEPRRQPSRDPKATKSGAAALPFLVQVNLLFDTFQAPDGNNYALISDKSLTAGGEVLGWVPQEYVLTQSLCSMDARSLIPRKAIVINSLEALRTGTPDGKRLLAPEVNLAVDPVGRADGEMRFFEIYFVWADTNRANPKKGYALLGFNPSFDQNSTFASVDEFRKATRILGWVDKERLCFWQTREAVQWEDREPRRDVDSPRLLRELPVTTFASRGHAIHAIDPGGKDAVKPDPTKLEAVIAEKFTDAGRPAVWDPRRMRYPLLTITTADGKTLADEQYKTHTLRRVGVIGDVVGKDGKSVMTERARQEYREELIRTRQQLARTEILFVIDQTVSMKDWWPKTADAIRRFVVQVDREDRSVAVALCFYGDIYPGTKDEGVTKARDAVGARREILKEGAVVPGELLDAKADKRALDAKLKALSELKEMFGGTRPELVYSGLEIGLMEAKGWSDSARKMVVLIGDDGNHPLDSKQEEEMHNRIAALCVREKEKDRFCTPIEFYALHVGQPVSPKDPKDEWNQFKVQINTLIGRINARAKAAGFDSYKADYFAVADEAGFHATIEARYAALVAHAKKQEDILLRIQSGQINAVTEIKDKEVERMLESIAAKLNLKPDDLLAGVQAFDERWVIEMDAKGVKQLRRMLYVSGGELDEVIKLLDRFFPKGGAKPLTLPELARGLIAIQGNDPDLKNKSDYEKLLALKVQYEFSFVDEIAKYLGYHLPDDAPRPKRDEARETLLKQRLEKKLLLLKDLRAEVVGTYEKHKNAQPPDEVGLSKVKSVDLVGNDRRGVLQGTRSLKPGEKPDERATGGELWYWVDFEEEWP